MDDTNYYENMIAELRAERDAWLQLWDGIKEHHAPDLGDANKPLAVAANYELLIRERDALAALLKSLSDEVQRTWYNADSYAESQRGLTHIKRLIDDALAGEKNNGAS